MLQPKHKIFVVTGDVLGSRCIFSNEGEDEVVQGLTSHMEMCDLFLYVYIDLNNKTLDQV